MIKLYLPVCNGADFIETVEIPSAFEVTVIDAASTDQTAEKAQERGWSVERRLKRTERVENWEFAVGHFIRSQGTWCKWLFTGDSLYPEAHEILKEGMLSVPQAMLVICEYDIVNNGKKTRWKMFENSQLISPPQTALLTAKLGNWFGSPVGQAFHRDAVVDDFSFGPWMWAAEMQFCYNIAKKWPVLYLAESIGEFHVPARKTFSVQCNALSSSVEEYLIRMQAARDYFHETKDSEGYEQLCAIIIEQTESAIIVRACNRSQKSEDIDHLFNAIPLNKLCTGLVKKMVRKLRRVAE